MPDNSTSINFVKNKQIPFLDRFIAWALSVGRLIVILTETVAIITFVYRFSLDEKLVDLHSEIKHKQNIISALKPDENKYRNLQDRIALASTFSEKGNKTSQTITEIIGLIPTQATINNLILNKDRINISVNTTSVSSLTNFVNPLKSYPGIKSISIDNIENKPLTGLSVDITAILK